LGNEKAKRHVNSRKTPAHKPRTERKIKNKKKNPNSSPRQDPSTYAKRGIEMAVWQTKREAKMMIGDGGNAGRSDLVLTPVMRSRKRAKCFA
jgi:hypothetical protein